MLLRFGVENHRSIRNYQELLLTASAFKEHGNILLPSSDAKVHVVPTAAIYGANAAGKSTLLDAIRFMQDVVVHSHSRGNASGGTAFYPFALDDDSKDRSSRYDIDFELDEIRYHYGFRLDGKQINEEWLYATPLTKSRKTRQTWFHRTDDGDAIYFGKELKGENKLIERIVRKNSLFLSAAAQNSHPQLSIIYTYFAEKMRLSSPLSDSTVLGNSVALFFEEHKQLEAPAIEFLRMGDTGISGMKFKSVPISDSAKNSLGDFADASNRYGMNSVPDDILGNGIKTAVLLHKGANGKDYELALRNESAGTQALLSALGQIMQCLMAGGVLVVDELSNSLHPLMSRKVVTLFADPDINVGRAQLIFSTHDTNLLCDGLFRRDQIWFAEKDREGATHLYPLTDIEVDKRDNLEKGYLQGRFGAVPFFGNIDEKSTSASDVSDPGSEEAQYD